MDKVYFIEKGKANTIFKEEYADYKKSWAEDGYQLIYLPQVLKELTEESCIFLTGQKNALSLSMQDIYKQMFSADFYEELPTYSFVYYDFENKYEYIPFFEKNLEKSPKEEISTECYKISESNSIQEKHFDNYEYEVFEAHIEPHIQVSLAPLEMKASPLLKEFPNLLTPDQQKSIDQAQRIIQELIDKGIPIEIIRELLKPKIKLNKLVITKDYRIMIPDIEKVVEMVPLEKALFLTYLKHKEGINFKNLSDYSDEIYEIYRKISPRFNFLKLKKSVNSLVDVTSNTINVKTTHIRKAFQNIFDDQIAKYYYISGEKGENKKILLDRNLVEWEE